MAKAKTADGKTITVPHGMIVGLSFKREIDGRSVRWSDDSFSLNWYALKRLEEKFKPKFIQYVLRTATKREVYTLSFDDFKKHMKEVVNEYGEKNYRVEMSCFRITKSESFDPVPTKEITTPEEYQPIIDRQKLT